MKPILLCLSLCLIANVTFAQNWCHPGSKWSYYIESFGGPAIEIYSYVKDTAINGQSCHQLSITSYASSLGARPDTFAGVHMYTFSDVDTIYFFLLNKNKWQATYHWGARAGDTVLMPNAGGLGGSGDTVVHAFVDSAGLMTINGAALRYYSFHLLDSCRLQYAFPGTIVERLGILDNSLIPNYICATDFTYYSLCSYQDDSFALYPSGGCPALPTAIREVSLPSFSCLPNPANDEISIVSDMLSPVVSISNINGQEVLSQEMTESDQRIKVGALPDGLYLISISQDGLRSAPQRLLIIH